MILLTVLLTTVPFFVALIVGARNFEAVTIIVVPMILAIILCILDAVKNACAEEPSILIGNRNNPDLRPGWPLF